MRIFLCLLLTLSACAPVVNVQTLDNSVVISKVYDKDYYMVWEALLAYLDESHFVVEKADKNDGFIRLSFASTEPDGLIDCGIVENSGRLATDNQYFYSYRGTDSPIYTVFLQNGIGYQSVRTIRLEGATTLHVEVLSRKSTRVSVYTQYELTEQYQYHTSIKEKNKMVPMRKVQTDTMYFSTNAPGRFNSENSMVCVANDVVEKNILEQFPAKFASNTDQE